jgi:hypothetical protein
MAMQMFSFSQLVAFAAYLLLTYAFFILAGRTGSVNARISAIGFAYCALAIVAQLVLSLSPELASSISIDHMTPSSIYYWVLYGVRPYILLLTAIFALRYALNDSRREREEP